MPPPPAPTKKSFPLSHFQQPPPPATPSTARSAGKTRPHAFDSAESSSSRKKARTGDGFDGAVDGELGLDASATKATGGKKSKQFMPMNTFAPGLPPSTTPIAPRKSAPALKPLPAAPPPPSASPFPAIATKAHGGRTGASNSRVEPSALTGNAVAGSSRRGAAERPPRKAAQRHTAKPAAVDPSKASPKLRPLPAFAPPTKPALDRLPPKPLVTPPRPQAFKSALPLPPASPPKPLLGTPPSARAAMLFNALPSAKGKGKIKEEPAGTRTLLESIPPAPTPNFEWDGERDGLPECWSPKKKKAGHLVSGLASRASGLLSSARTAQTLWLHDLSRQLTTQYQDHPLTRPLLAKLLRPSLRFQVTQVLPFGTARQSPLAFDFQSSPSRRRMDEHKTVLTRCRLALTNATLENLDTTEGLVLFSLNDHPPAASQPRTSVPRRNATKSIDMTDETPRTIFLPSNPHDLRFIEEGAEVWVWQPSYEIVEGGAEREGENEEEAEQMEVDAREEDEDEVEVVWQPAGGLVENQTRGRETATSHGIRRALVCGKFAILL